MSKTAAPSQHQGNRAPDWAFIAAAGLGQRMKPLTDTCPKPLIKVAGQSLLDHIVDHLQAAGIQDIVLNTHYLPQQIEQWAEQRAANSPNLRLTLYYEPELLDTGGGVLRVIREEKRQSPFYMINGDAFWINAENMGQNDRQGVGTQWANTRQNMGRNTKQSPKSAQKPCDLRKTLGALAQNWCSHNNELLLLLEPTRQMTLTTPIGDYHIDEKTERPVRSPNRTGDYMFTGLRICDPALFQNMLNDTDCAAHKAFSFLELMDAAQKRGTLGALVHEGRWHHLSTPDDVKRVNDAFARSQNDIGKESSQGKPTEKTQQIEDKDANRNDTPSTENGESGNAEQRTCKNIDNKSAGHNETPESKCVQTKHAGAETSASQTRATKKMAAPQRIKPAGECAQ